jgi:hypothetical protein
MTKLTPEEIRRILLTNDDLMKEVAPSFRNMDIRDMSGETLGLIKSGALPSTTNNIEYDDKVLYPSIMETFKSKKEMEDMSNDSLLKLQEQERLNRIRGYNLRPRVGSPKTEEEITRPYSVS